MGIINVIKGMTLNATTKNFGRRPSPTTTTTAGGVEGAGKRNLGTGGGDRGRRLNDLQDAANATALLLLPPRLY